MKVLLSYICLSIGAIYTASACAVALSAGGQDAVRNDSIRQQSSFHAFLSIAADDRNTWTAYASDPDDFEFFTDLTLLHNGFNGDEKSRQHLTAEFNEGLLRSSQSCTLFQALLSPELPPHLSHLVTQVFQTCQNGDVWSPWKKTNIPRVGTESVAPDDQRIWVSSSTSRGHIIRRYKPAGEEGRLLAFEADGSAPVYRFEHTVSHLTKGDKCLCGWLHQANQVIKFCNDAGGWWISWRKMPGSWTKDTPDIDITAMAADNDYLWLAIKNPNTFVTKIVHLDPEGNLVDGPYAISSADLISVEPQL